MARIAVCADVHVGNPSQLGGPVVAGINTRGGQVLDTLERALARAENKGAERLIICGDLADTSRLRPQLVRAIQERFEGFNGQVDILVGNHDQESDLPGDNALAPLRAVESVTVIERPTFLTPAACDLIYVPFQTGPAAEWFPLALADQCGVLGDLSSCRMGPTRDLRVLAFHAGVKDAQTVHYLADSPGALDVDFLFELMEKHSIQFAFCGDWHDHRIWTRGEGASKRTICQIGALCPTGWSNPGLEGHGKLAILDTESRELTIHDIPGPRFLNAKSPAEAEALLAKVPAGCLVYLRLHAAPGKALDEARAFVEALKGLGQIANGEAVPDDSAAREQAQEAGRVARSAETLDEAIRGFVETMPLPEGVERAAVMDEVRVYARRDR